VAEEHVDKLPATIVRWCCSPHKRCGNTSLRLVDNDSPAGWPPLYDYVRSSNGDSYSGWHTEDEMRTWLAETRDHVQAEDDESNPTD
jgi:hypothetical protein